MAEPNTRSEPVGFFDLQRRVVSHMTSESWKNIPHVTYLYEPDVTKFIEEFNGLAETKTEQDHRISINTIMLRVIIEGLKTSPKLNSRIQYNHVKGEGTLTISTQINISIPWLLPDGRLITPVLSNTEAMTVDELSNAIAALGGKIKNTNIDEMLYQAARKDTLDELKKFHLDVLRRVFAVELGIHRIKKLTGQDRRDYYRIPSEDRLPAENLTQGTVTVSNIGSLYKEQKGAFGILEIIPPQIFAIGLGAIQEKPGVFVNDRGQKEIGIRKVIPMCLAFDHRAVDFNVLIPFLKRLDEIFAEPGVIRTW